MGQNIISTLALATTAAAHCACGYTVNSTDGDSYALFTDLFETDFLHVQDVNFNTSYTVGWEPQDYNTSASVTDGPYGMAKLSNNLVANFILDQQDWKGPGCIGGDPGLQLWVNSGLIDDGDQQLVPSAEIVSQRDDILYGSFRVAMKTTGVNGTCGAFFFYRNDSQEVDLEILSVEQHNETSSWPVHLVVQDTFTMPERNHTRSDELVYDLAFPPGGDVANYNEYRFDWLPDRIDYYVNSWFMWSVTENIPSAPGRIHISHWSNGNPYWTHGPPKQDAVMTVSYVKAYFNSTNSTRTSDYNYACGSTNSLQLHETLQQTCQIPDQELPPNPTGPKGNTTGYTFFFTHHHNMTNNQTVYDDPLDSPANGFASWRASAGKTVMMAGAAILVSWAVGKV